MTDKQLRCPALSPRLMAAASQVREGSVTADVGCDHGKLSAFLLESGKTPFVYASDIRPGPLSAARELISSLELQERCRLSLADGLADADPEQVKDVVIAGIGADITARIISGAPWLRDPSRRLVLVPASKHERLRGWLAAEGFATVAERAVADRGHMYTVLTVHYDGRVRTPDILERWLGRIDTSAGEGRLYLELVRERMERIVRSVPDENNESLREAKAFLEKAKEAGLGT